MTAIELSVLHFFQDIQMPILNEIMIFVSWINDVGLVWIFLGIGLAVFKKTRHIGIALLISLCLAALVGNLVIKPLIARDRPFITDETLILLIDAPSSFSFPSGHTITSFAAASSIFFFSKKWGSIALVLASLIGFSRIYLTVHYPTDVFAGVVLGASISYLVYSLMKKSKLYKRI